MQILSISRYYGVPGGKNRYADDLSELLGAHSHSVIPFAIAEAANGQSEYDVFFPHSLPTHSHLPYKQLYAAVKRLYNVEARNALTSLCHTYHVDIAHVHDHLHLSTSIFDVLREVHIPVVYTLHDFHLICPAGSLLRRDQPCELCKDGHYSHAVRHRCSHGKLSNSLISATDNWLTSRRHSLQDVRQFIAPSAFVKHTFEEFGWDPERLRVIPHFVPRGHWQTTNVPMEGPILFSGRLVRQKGVHILLSAIAKLKLPRNLSVIIAGDGPERPTLQEQQQALNLDNVCFVGNQNRVALNALLSRCQFVVVPPIGYETFGLSILEAFASGRAVVASDIGAFPEIVTDGIEGRLCQPNSSDDLAEKLDWMLSHIDRVREMGHAAHYRYCRDFSEEAHYEKLLHVYESAVATGASIPKR